MFFCWLCSKIGISKVYITKGECIYAQKSKLLAGIITASLAVTSFPATMLPATGAKAAATPEETTITKTEVSNPVLPSGSEGTLPYGGDPSVLVDGDTVYLYTGRDSSKSEGYYMLDWQCYSTKDLKTWKNEGVIMSADKKSIKWANTGTDAWAGQVEKYNGKYYFYYCTWDSTSSGQQSIGVAVSDKATGPFTDIGKPLVKGIDTSNTSGNWSTFNDIDPAVWVEKDDKGVEHRYLCWGNNKLFICELNEDMVSVKDINGDGKITFGVQANGADSSTADIIEKTVTGMDFTEAPWIYRRKDASGNPYGQYYIFYARKWREEMAYATTDDLMNGKSVPDNGNKDAYVSIQSNNKAGLYLTVNEGLTVTLAQDAKYDVSSGSIKADADTAKAQTFRTVKGLDGTEGAVSFESVYKPGNYLALSGGQLVLSDGSNAMAATFVLNGTAKAPEAGTGTDTGIASLEAGEYAADKKDDTYSLSVPFETTTVKVSFKLADSLAYVIADGTRTLAADTLYIPLSGKTTVKTITVYAADGKTSKDYTITISKAVPASSVPVSNDGLFKAFTFEDKTDGAFAVTKAFPPATIAAPYNYTEGKDGKAIQLSGSYGLKLCDAAGLGSNYSISYWMKPDKVKTNVDPTLAAGLFRPEYWLNLTFGRAIWSKANDAYIDDAGTVTYKENEWQHVTLTVEGSQAKLYVNGELSNTGSIASDIMSQAGAAIYFGVNAWDAYFEGALDEVAIFNRVLSAGEIQSIAYEAVNVSSIAGTAVQTPGPAQTQTPQEPSASQAPDDGDGEDEEGVTVDKVTVKAANQKPGTKTVYLKNGGKVTLSASVKGTGDYSKAVTWKSSKTKVATVSSKGVVKAKAAGTAKITVTSKTDKDKKAVITIQVSKNDVKNKKLELKAAKKSLNKGKTYTIGIKSLTKKTTDAVTYKSSDKGVASVDKFGVVTAKKTGKAVITVTCGSKSAKLKVTVK